jgi:hypothetical protein
MASRAIQIGPALALLVALGAGSAIGGCGKYGHPVRSAPAEASAPQLRTPAGLEAETPAIEDDDEHRECERSEEE